MPREGRPESCGECTVTARFVQPASLLRPGYVTLYVIDIDAPADGAQVVDWHYPEWAALRIARHAFRETWTDGRVPGVSSRTTLVGPASRGLRFETGATRMWIIRFQPLGWARYFGLPSGAMASDFADGIFDVGREPRLAHFRGLASAVDAAGAVEGAREAGCEAELAAILRWFATWDERSVPDAARIEACHAALLREDVRTVGDLSAASGLPAHTLERLCQRHFGFPPQMLVRRERFLRSMRRHMRDPAARWTRAMDSQYYDQAQFVRDFRRFMGMTPSDYASHPHPVMGPVMQAQEEALAQALAQAPQALTGP